MKVQSNEASIKFPPELLKPERMEGESQEDYKIRRKSLGYLLKVYKRSGGTVKGRTYERTEDSPGMEG